MKKKINYGTIPCEECGKMFEKTAPNAKYCCPECKKEAYAKLQKKHNDAIIAARRRSGGWKACRHCGRLFEASSSWRAYCSEACKADAQKQRDLERQLLRRLGGEKNREAEAKRAESRRVRKPSRGFSWAEVLECMKENNCQYVRAVEILNKRKDYQK